MVGFFSRSWFGRQHPKKDRASPILHSRVFTEPHANPHLTRRRRRTRLPFLLAFAAIAVVTWHYFHSSSSPSAPPSRTISKDSLRKLLGVRSKAPPGSSLIHASSSPFLPSADPLPVHHEEHQMIYHNYPLSIHRPPPNQFLHSPSASTEHPVVAIITATNNPRRAALLETATSLFGQSLQNFLWVIVDDHTDDSDSLAVLREIAESDPRVVLLHNLGFKGLSQGRNVGLKHVFERKEVPPYLISLDDDDLFELTALEKLTWMMESNKEWALGGFYYVKWGEGANETVTTGLHSGADNWIHGNFVPNAAVYRSDAVLESGCRYDEKGFSAGGEDWDFWMCLAGGGYWGGTALEFLYWYRANPPSFRAKRWGDTFKQGPGSTFLQLREHIQKKHDELGDAFPVKFPRPSVHLEPVTWEPPFDSGLASTDKSIVFIVPWLYLGGADIGALHMVQVYAEAGYRVTVICTLFKTPQGIELKPEMLKWTHDVHVLPSFLRANDFPRYIKHLITSRGSEEVIFSNSQLIYEMLPALVEQLPDVKFIDYLHNEAYDGWKSGGYPRYSIIQQRYLARTITCSSYLRNWLLDHGHLDASRIGVVKLGIDIGSFKPPNHRERHAAKAQLLQLEPETTAITFVGRINDQKRPLLLPRIIDSLLDKVGQDFLLFVIGDGEQIEALKRQVRLRKLDDYIRILGARTNVRDYLAASDIFLLPSLSEGISVAVSEAMAMGLPIVTANAGALPEQLGVGTTQNLGGVLVDHTIENEESDAEMYAYELGSLITDYSARRKLGDNARKIMEQEPGWRESLKGLMRETKLASNLLEFRREADPRYPNPAVYAAIEALLLEDRKTTDFFGNYPNKG